MDDVANRYDDRVTLRCNLIKVYDRLTEFTLRHMPDKLYLPEGSMQRVDVRLALMREIIGNLCVHTDYRIGISNGQQFVFAITYADAEDGNVGRNQEMSVETTKCR